MKARGGQKKVATASKRSMASTSTKAEKPTSVSRTTKATVKKVSSGRGKSVANSVPAKVEKPTTRKRRVSKKDTVPKNLDSSAKSTTKSDVVMVLDRRDSDGNEPEYLVVKGGHQLSEAKWQAKSQIKNVEKLQAFDQQETKKALEATPGILGPIWDNIYDRVARLFGL